MLASRIKAATGGLDGNLVNCYVECVTLDRHPGLGIQFSGYCEPLKESQTMSAKVDCTAESGPKEPLAQARREAAEKIDQFNARSAGP